MLKPRDTVTRPQPRPVAAFPGSAVLKPATLPDARAIFAATPHPLPKVARGGPTT